MEKGFEACEVLFKQISQDESRKVCTLTAKKGLDHLSRWGQIWVPQVSKIGMQIVSQHGPEVGHLLHAACADKADFCAILFPLLARHRQGPPPVSRGGEGGEHHVWETRLCVLLYVDVAPGEDARVRLGSWAWDELVDCRVDLPA